jgi:hypothetical protein
MTRPGAYEMPSWAISILFWRKVHDLVARGVPWVRLLQKRPSVS